MNYTLSITDPNNISVTRVIDQAAAEHIIGSVIAARASTPPADPLAWVIDQIIGDLLDIAAKHEAAAEAALAKQQLDAMRASLAG